MMANLRGDLPEDDQGIGSDRMWYPVPTLGFAEFEAFVAETFEQLNPLVEGYRVQLHDRIDGVDGQYDFDATVRFELGGLAFLVLVEAKHHSYPIKRDVVQVLASKVASVGAQKGVVIATTPFQQGAITFASTHGIALIKVTEGRFTFETRSRELTSTLSREQARRWGVAEFVGHEYAAMSGGGTAVTLVSEYPLHLLEVLMGPGNVGEHRR